MSIKRPVDERMRLDVSRVNIARPTDSDRGDERERLLGRNAGRQQHATALEAVAAESHQPHPTRFVENRR
jgi:hypothetical protein